MKSLICTICLLLIVGSIGCDDKESTHPPPPQKKIETKLTEIGETEKPPPSESKSEPVFDLMKSKGTPRQKLSALDTAAKKGQQWIIEIRKPAVRALENIRINEFLSMPGIPAEYIRTGPGMEYEDDDTGALFENDPLYVLEEKNGWIRFRVTQANLGWSAWTRKDLTSVKE